MKGVILILLCLCGLLFCACPPPSEDKVPVEIRFSFSVDGAPLEVGKMQYRNVAGNLYQIDEIKFFVSDFYLYDQQGKSFSIQSNEGIHYINHSLTNTYKWHLTDNFHPGKYDSLVFTFGLNPEKNTSHRFTDSPEKDMAWPEVLGGGYHYMQINGKWQKEDGSIVPFNLHTGIGQMIFNGETQFIHNCTNISLPLSHFILSNEQTSFPVINLEMDVNQWFTNPEIFDFNVLGTSIMQNQEAQIILKKNAWNVFSIK